MKTLIFNNNLILNQKKKWTFILESSLICTRNEQVKKKKKLVLNQHTVNRRFFLIFDWYMHTSNYTRICLWGWFDADLLSNTYLFDSHSWKHCIKDINANYIFQLLPKTVIKKLQRCWELIIVFWILHIITCWKRERRFFKELSSSQNVCMTWEEHEEKK